ncbi:MAG: 3-isopropylmalate dehydratase small subunit [Planctomycetota bacterium]|nr:MAG: 3-isopropylmalate dehydratase small subunit [Planctomycetota bacterium]
MTEATEIIEVRGRGVPLVLDDIDTDRIIPARYLRCVTFEGLGEHAFEDDRKQDPSHPFDDPRFQGGSILIVGRNFGCGSSREHAPQSLMRWGIRALIGESFAEIFFGNCTSLGIPAVTAPRERIEELAAAVQAEPQLEIRIDLQAKRVEYGDRAFDVEIPESARDALVTGRWDFLTQLLEAKDQILATAERLPYMNGFRDVTDG